MMRNLLFFIALVFVVACKENPKESPNPAEMSTEIQDPDPYPQSLQEVFEAHGGLNLWRKQRTLSFRMPHGEAFEVHTIDLYSRKDHIQGRGYSLGFDGEKVWINDTGSAFEGDPEFYHNLMFYFYAMPFVLADDGIEYGPADALEFDGKTYPGIGISYQTGVGSSPKDQYYLYYHPETHRMAWLGYTVTYFSDSPSQDIHWIRYNDWQEVSGLLLPANITWYDHEGRVMKEPRDTVTFEQAALSEKSKDAGFYQMPEGGQVAGKQEQ